MVEAGGNWGLLRGGATRFASSFGRGPVAHVQLGRLRHEYLADSGRLALVEAAEADSGAGSEPVALREVSRW